MKNTPNPTEIQCGCTSTEYVYNHTTLLYNSHCRFLNKQKKNILQIISLHFLLCEILFFFRIDITSTSDYDYNEVLL